MIQITFNFNDIAAAAALFAKLNGHEIGAMQAHGLGQFGSTPQSVSADEKAAVLNGSNDKADTVKQTAAPGKPAKAKPAATEPTAPASDASTPSSGQASPTTPPADAPAAFEYATLQKAVVAAAPKHGKAKLIDIAAKHGASDFKSLPAAAWQAAYDDVVALGV